MSVLNDLDSEGLADLGATIGGAEALRLVLSQRPEVSAVRRALAEGALAFPDVRDFVSTLLMDLRRGERFPHDVALAALAVALEDHPGDHAAAYLEDLARTRIAELRASPIVAAACLRERRVVPATYGHLTLESALARPELVAVECWAPSSVESSDQTYTFEAA